MHADTGGKSRGFFLVLSCEYPTTVTTCVCACVRVCVCDSGEGNLDVEEFAGRR